MNTCKPKKTKKAYERPRTTVTYVELESTVCSGSVEFGGDNQDRIEIENQQINKDFSDGNDFSGQTWGDNGTQN